MMHTVRIRRDREQLGRLGGRIVVVKRCPIRARPAAGTAAEIPRGWSRLAHRIRRAHHRQRDAALVRNIEVDVGGRTKEGHLRQRLGAATVDAREAIGDCSRQEDAPELLTELRALKSVFIMLSSCILCRRGERWWRRWTI